MALEINDLRVQQFLNKRRLDFFLLSEVKAKGIKIIPTKLVFKKKCEIDGTICFKTSDVSIGFMMIPGVVFIERFSPVETDGSL